MYAHLGLLSSYNKNFLNFCTPSVENMSQHSTENKNISRWLWMFSLYRNLPIFSLSHFEGCQPFPIIHFVKLFPPPVSSLTHSAKYPLLRILFQLYPHPSLSFSFRATLTYVLVSADLLQHYLLPIFG